jgi:hypothetical protein
MKSYDISLTAAPTGGTIDNTMELNPPNILIALRDRLANDVESLRKLFQLDEYYGPYKVQNELRQLEEAGLVVNTVSAGSLAGAFEVAPNWHRIQATLGLSLRKLGEASSDSMVVRPYFGKPAGFGASLDVFVLMSFKPELRPVYEDHILNVTNSINLVAKRADDFFGAHHIMSDVWEAINSARVIIADCTGRNPNVFYEIGVAHTLGRTVILITQNGGDVPFDLQAIRYIQYEYTPRGMAIFEKSLEQTLKVELEAAAKARLPAPDYGAQITRRQA